jgi:Fe-Mn family superoxide dismutase
VPIRLPPLPYARDALAPHLSAETLDYHHGKHHRAYVDAVNTLIAGTPDEGATLEQLVKKAEGPLFNAAAQAWNHEFYWNSMRPGGGGEPTGSVAAALREHLGPYSDFRRLFKEAALARFGSGWAWLVAEQNRIFITTTPDADLPLRTGRTALLACDVWEHAYYVDYRNRRGDYVDAFLDHLVNWDWVAKNLA